MKGTVLAVLRLALIWLSCVATLHATVSAPRESAALQWAPSANGTDVRWPEAEAYCRALDFAGHNDWRLPTIDELERFHAAGAETAVTDTCCLWSSTSLAALPADAGGAPGGAPEHYFWGLLLDGGIPYYSNQVFTDGQAHCVRATGTSDHQ